MTDFFFLNSENHIPSYKIKIVISNKGNIKKWYNGTNIRITMFGNHIIILKTCIVFYKSITWMGYCESLVYVAVLVNVLDAAVIKMPDLVVSSRVCLWPPDGEAVYPGIINDELLFINVFMLKL